MPAGAGASGVNGNGGRSHANGSGGGHGVAGMAERAAAFGGTLRAGPAATGRLGGHRARCATARRRSRP